MPGEYDCNKAVIHPASCHKAPFIADAPRVGDNVRHFEYYDCIDEIQSMLAHVGLAFDVVPLEVQGWLPSSVA
jgi:hypothetical protein